MTNRYDILLAALSTVGYCSRAQFASYCHQIVSPEVPPPFIRRAFAQLAHIDVFAGERRHICVTPPAIVITDGTPIVVEGFLCGSRTPGFLETIVSVARDRDIEVRKESQGSAAEVIRFRADSESDLEKLAHAGDIGYAGHAATRLAAVLPTICLKRTESFSRRQFLDSQTKWLDLTSAKYLAESGGDISACTISPPFGSAKYFFVRHESVWPMGQYEATHLAAAQNGLKWVRYDMETRILSIDAKAPLPLLYERAAVLSSGREPSFEERTGVLNFENVSGRVANAIIEKLGKYVEVNRA